MRAFLAAIACGLATVAGAGCAVHYVPAEVEVDAPPPVVVEPAVVVGPVIDGPGVVVADVEPAPIDRVYVYDPGFPPGCYFYNGFYWYGGYRYDHDVFINRYVTLNVRDHRFIDVAANRRVARARIERQRADFARTSGRRDVRNVRDVHSARRGPQHEGR